MRIPFDHLVLAAVLAEIRGVVGAKVQKVVAAGPNGVGIQLYHREALWINIHWHAEHYRLTLSRRGPDKSDLNPLVSELRRLLDGARLDGALQLDRDRVAILQFATAEGGYQLVAELMGKHSNLILVGPDRRMVAAAKWLGATRTTRPVLPGREYPPLPASGGESPFLTRLRAAGAEDRSLNAVFEGNFSPVYVEGVGAYPVSVAALGLAEHPTDSIGEPLELHAVVEEQAARFRQLRTSLQAQFARAIDARRRAEADLLAAADTAARAAELQQRGELILAYMGALQGGESKLEAWDYAGNPVEIPLNRELTAKENAQRLFDKAKRAKSREGEVKEQLTRVQGDLEDLRVLLNNLDAARELRELQQTKAYAESKGFFRHQVVQARSREERPYQGHRIRELLAPHGFMVLLGENAEANDYLTLRVAKPNDWWFHVRAAPGSHVILQTRNQPDRVPPEVMRWAASVAARHSSQKHSSYVPVDYTLKRYVRRVRGAAPGMVQYTHEKTLHVESGV